jgi:hypothetical protein
MNLQHSVVHTACRVPGEPEALSNDMNNINYVSYQKALSVLRVRALSWASGMCAHFKSDFARSGPTFYKPVIWSEHSLNYINQELFFCCGDRVEFARLRKCLQIVPLEDKIYVRCSDLESCEFCA